VECHLLLGAFSFLLKLGIVAVAGECAAVICGYKRSNDEKQGEAMDREDSRGEWSSGGSVPGRARTNGADRGGTSCCKHGSRTASMSGELRPGVLFDVDGTLVDTNYLHALAWSRAFREVGEWAPMNAIHRLIGMGGDQLVVRLLGHESPDAVAARPRHYKQLIDDISVFPQARALLRLLHAEGLAVVLATSAPSDELDILRAALGADDVIDGQTTSDDISQSKPSPEVFEKAMGSFSIDPRHALAIGDSIWDVRAARAAGIGCLAVETGGFSQHELSEVGARHVYRDVAEIFDQLHTGPLVQLFP
jgi:HAD superfamily hydrolase (TIGR01509 family)